MLELELQLEPEPELNIAPGNAVVVPRHFGEMTDVMCRPSWYLKVERAGMPETRSEVR